MLGPRMLVFSVLCVSAIAGTAGPGSTCTTANDHLDPGSHKFLSECNDLSFCSGVENGTCVPRKCVRDEFPFGFGPDETIPSQCPIGTFCPDEGSDCRALAAVGGACQLNRDEQCAPPADWKDLSSTQNFNGSICLHTVCMYANVTLGQRCVTDNTTYTDFGPNNQPSTNTITRDNCRSPQFYCDGVEMVCERTKAVGLACSFDQECELRECSPAGVCAYPPETPLRVAPWQYAITAICILGAMIATCILLTLIHKRHRLDHYREVREYYYEQISLRRSIIALHSAATDGYLPTPNKYT